VLELLRREVQARAASLLVLDGLSAIEETAASGREFKKFIHELQAQAAIADCTMLLLTSLREASAEHTLVDGVIELQTKLYGRRAERILQIHKMRGSDYLRGEHSFRITDEGIAVYPRTEAVLAHPSVPDKVTGPPLSTGVAHLDRIMGGGFPRHSTALLVGPPGVGKTTLGLHFLSECDKDAPGLYFGFYETPAAICDKANVLGLPLGRLIGQGHVEVIWQPTTEGLLDQTCDRLIAAVRRRGARRLFIDGLQGFDRLAPEPERLGHIFSAFSSELRGRGISTLFTAEADLIGPVLGLPLSGLSLQGVSCIAEIILVMRYVELRSQLHRMISVLKVRDADIDCALHRFMISGKGIVIDPDSTAAEEILAEATTPGRIVGTGNSSED
jgi:circadian clock protein KaiC